MFNIAIGSLGRLGRFLPNSDTHGTHAYIYVAHHSEKFHEVLRFQHLRRSYLSCIGTLYLTVTLANKL